MENNTLWYRQPAQEWVESLPLGNGRIGAMVFGGIVRERIALNEDTLWSGYPKDKNNHHAAEYLPHARELAESGRMKELENWIEDHMEGDYTESYMPLGDISLIFSELENKEITDYRRSLDLERAAAVTTFSCGGTAWRREAFVSGPQQAFMLHISTDSKAAVSFRASLTSPLRNEVKAEHNRVIMDGICPSHAEPSYIDSDDPIIYEEDPQKKGIGFRGVLQILAKGGSCRAEGEEIIVEKADEAVITFTVRTSFNGFDRQPWTQGKEYKNLCSEDADRLIGTDFEKCLAENAEEFGKLYGRVEFCLDGPDREDMPVDERLIAMSEGNADPGLACLIFRYGRYLLISSSKKGTQAANLQGIWNQELRAPWSSNYTININTEMNYWPAESCNLSECHEPLFDCIRELRTTGAETARLHYGASGVVSHHNTDIWRISNPVGRTDRGSVGFAYWCMSFGWLCQHLYSHYEYTCDREFLESTAYPAIRDAAVFYLDVMTEDHNGNLVICPSTSPENAYLLNGEKLKVAETTTMTNAIIREVFTNCMRCCEILGRDKELAERIKAAYDRIPPYRIGRRGNLMEWPEDFEDAEVRHRHISHLYPLYPGNEFTRKKTPELTEACRKALEIRGDEGTGWSLGWKICTWARLRDGNHALKLIKRQLRPVTAKGYNYSDGGGTYPNLFDAHPPFQIDGNFAVAAGIAEMFVQNEDNEITFLPAIPDEWKDGCMKGLRAKHGLVVQLYFRDGKLEKAELYAEASPKKDIKLVSGDNSCSFVPEKGKHYCWIPGTEIRAV